MSLTRGDIEARKALFEQRCLDHRRGKRHGRFDRGHGRLRCGEVVTSDLIQSQWLAGCLTWVAFDPRQPRAALPDPAFCAPICTSVLAPGVAPVTRTARPQVCSKVLTVSGLTCDGAACTVIGGDSGLACPLIVWLAMTI